MAAASWLGFPPQSRIVPPALVGGLWLARLRTESAFLLLAWGTGFVSTVLKAIMRRPRPVARLAEAIGDALRGGINGDRSKRHLRFRY